MVDVIPMERNFLIDNVKGVLACMVLLAHTPPTFIC